MRLRASQGAGGLAVGGLPRLILGRAGAARQRHAEIVRLEMQLSARVFALIDLTPAEIKLIEESTKYRYGEV
jgi:hypothetical protein